MDTHRFEYRGKHLTRSMILMTKGGDWMAAIVDKFRSQGLFNVKHRLNYP